MDCEGLKAPWTKLFSNVASETDIYFFFRILFGRNPSEPEWYCHKTYAGRNLFDLFESYATSEEFQKRMAKTNKNVSSNEKLRKVYLESLDMHMILPEKDYAIGDVIFETKTYEPQVLACLQNILRKGMNFLDIGANVGWYTLWGSRLVGREGTVLSIEAGVDNVRFLFANRDLNKLSNVMIYHLAATDVFCPLAYASLSSNGTVQSPEVTPEINIFQKEIVQGVPLDSILSSDLQIDVVKIDIEGSEFKALHGMREALKRWKPVIISEYSPYLLKDYSQVSGEEYLRFLLDLGYEAKIISETLIPVGDDLGLLDSEVTKKQSDHLDLVFFPKGYF